MCNTCVEWFGTPVEQGVFYLETCPFEGSSPRYFTPCSIRTGRNRKQAGLGKSGVQLSSGYAFMLPEMYGVNADRI